MDPIQQYFESSEVVEQYAAATRRVGLWRSEEKVFTRLFSKTDTLLELGCGTGRIAFGLFELGYCHFMATDFSRAMVKQARQIAQMLDYRVALQVADATALPFEDNAYDGAIFGFNGLMQIPLKEGREQALREVFRVLRPEAWFVFTTHDRDHFGQRDFWEAEAERWQEGVQSPELELFGDRMESTEEGRHFMHVPTVEEMEVLLERVGFRIEAHIMRSELANEPAEVREFSDDCRFWVLQKPPAS
ncbi:MAG: class I SAM-dependent methyltransferase [Coraliomargaritaceae bacterium]